MKSLIYITGVVLLLTSCLGTKKVQETKHEVFSEVKQDSISIQKKEIEIIPTLVQEESFTIPLEVAEQMEDFEKRISTQEGKASAAISKKRKYDYHSVTLYRAQKIKKQKRIQRLQKKSLLKNVLMLI